MELRFKIQASASELEQGAVMWECAMLFQSVRPSCPRSTLRWNLCSHSLFTPLSSHPSSALHVILFTLSPSPPFLVGPLYISPPKYDNIRENGAIG
jgi:hypothetical protein